MLPGVHVKAFTAIEIEQIAKKGGVSHEQALKDLMEAGLDSLPGTCCAQRESQTVFVAREHVPIGAEVV